jgi:hypothetical protein
MDKLSLDRESLKKFGFTMGFAFLAVTLIFSIKHKHIITPAFIIALIFFILAMVAPFLLKPVYIFWMRLGYILGWINTRIILSILFYFIFTPIGLCMRLFGIDLLEKRINKNKKSYWIEKEKEGLACQSYERQF